MKKLGVFLTGLAIALLTIELSLRGFAYLHAHVGGRAAGGVNVLCLGNSYTVGIGASSLKESYPSQLERLFHTFHPEVPLQVINGAKGNANTAQILDEVDALLTRYRPIAVTIMAGEPNQWNDYGIGRFLALRSEPTWGDRVRDLLHYSAIYRFYELTSGRFARSGEDSWSPEQWVAELSAKDIFKSGNLTLSPKENQLAYQAVETLRKAHPERVDLIFLELELALDAGDLTLSNQLAEAALRHKDARFDYYAYQILELVRSRRKKQFIGTIEREAPALGRLNALVPPAKELKLYDDFFHSATDALPASLRKDCDHLARILDSAPLRIFSYDHVLDCYFERGRAEEALALVQRGIRLNPLHPRGALRLLRKIREQAPSLQAKVDAAVAEFVGKSSAGYYLSQEEAKLRVDWAVHDIRQIIAKARAVGVKTIILQSYPPLRNQGWRPIDEKLPELAKSEGVIFEDIQSPLRETFRDPKKMDEYYTHLFGPQDGHLSDAGYGWVASDLYRVLEESHFLK